MEPDVIPPDLVASLREAGYRVAGPVGVGSHGPAWAAVGRAGGPRAQKRVVVTVLSIPGGTPGAGLRERLDLLSAVPHDHLAEVVDVVPLGQDGADPGDRGADPRPGRGARWAVLLAEVPGVNLATLLAARPPLTDGEVVTLVVPLAQALAALHDAGLVHGDVSPANVVVRPDGRPVLVDLLGTVTRQAGTRDGRGTPGFAAPEVERGARPEPPADVHALARAALAALAPRGDPALLELLERACAADPTLRPRASELAVRSYATVAPEPVVLPDAAVLARTSLARLAAEPGPGSVLTVRPAGSRHRAVRRGRAGLVRAVSALGVVAACGVVVALIARGPAGGSSADGPDAAGLASPGAVPTSASSRAPATPTPRSTAAGNPAAGPAGPAEPAEPAEPTATSGLTDPVAAAVALTERRAVLLASDDPGALAEVEVVGAPAQVADVALLAGLRAAGLRIDGLAADVVAARLVDPGAGAPVSRARVEVSSALTAHRRLAADGAVVADVPAQPARTVVLTLAWTSAGWRVAEVADAAVVAVSGSAR